MNCDEFRKEWPLVKNRVRRRWPGLTEREINRIDGRTDLLYRALVHTCGVRREDAARQLFEFLRAPVRAESLIGHG